MMGLEIYDLMVGEKVWKVVCINCGHQLGQHAGSGSRNKYPSKPYCWEANEDATQTCGCPGFQTFYYDKPSRPTAEEVYESLRNQ